MTRSAKLTAASIGAWGALGVLHLARVAGAAVPAIAQPLLAGAAAALATIAACCSLAAMWRGPELVAFPRGAAAACDPERAELVRAAARIRGTMGGGGHLHPARLLLATVAWGLAAAAAASVGVAARGGREPGSFLDVPPPLLVATGAAFALAAALPPRSFVYRELSGGGVIVHPRASFDDLVHRARAARRLETPGAPVPGGPQDGSPRSPPLEGFRNGG